MAVVFWFFPPSLPKTLPLHSEIRCDETVLAHFASEGYLQCPFRSYRRSEDRRKEGFGDKILGSYPVLLPFSLNLP